MIPLIDYRGNISFISNPAFLSQFASNPNSDLVVMAVWPRALAVMMEKTVASADSDWTIAANVENAFGSGDHITTAVGSDRHLTIIAFCSFSHITVFSWDYLNVTD